MFNLLLFSHSVMSDSLWPHGLQHARLLCPSPSPGACSYLSIELLMPSNHLVLCHPFLLLPSIFPSIRVFSNKSALCIRWPEYWSFSFCISPFNVCSGLISFRIDWFDLPAVQGTLQSLFQHHTSKASILWHSAFFMVHLSHQDMTIGKSTPLNIQTFVSKSCLCFLICCIGLSQLSFQWSSGISTELWRLSFFLDWPTYFYTSFMINNNDITEH